MAAGLAAVASGSLVPATPGAAGAAAALGPVGWIGLGIGAVSAGASILGGMDAKKKAKEAAKQQAKLVGIQRDRELELMRKKHAVQVGSAVAGVYASNVQMAGSSERYVNAMEYENIREQAYHRQAARQEQEAIRAGAQGAGSQLIAQGVSSALQTAATLYANRPQNDSSGYTSPLAQKNTFVPGAVPNPGVRWA